MSTDYDVAAMTGAAALGDIYPDGKRAVIFPDGLLVWVYVDPGTSSLVVSVDVDGVDVDSPLIRDDAMDSSLRLRVDVGGLVVFDDTDAARAAGQIVGC